MGAFGMGEKPASETGTGEALGVPTRRGEPSVPPEGYGADASGDGRKSWPIDTQLASGRMTITRRIGEGGMGVVYEAHDRERDARVALKTLNRLDPANVYALKNEFRALADVAHPNLVQLHELFAEGASWFFTMELVEGEPFDQWVRPRTLGQLDEARLRAALPQLFAAMSAIHAAGKLHRDLKPSNVLVTREGRVVVLDFGLVAAARDGGVGDGAAGSSSSGDGVRKRGSAADAGVGVAAAPRDLPSSRDRPLGAAQQTVPERGAGEPHAQATVADDAHALADTVAEHVGLPGPERGPSHSVSGTPAYMAPEQAAGLPATAASDYYALGVMLFEALTGDLPFTGKPGEILAAKQLSSAPRAREVALRRLRAAELEQAPTVSGRRRVSPLPAESPLAAAQASQVAESAAQVTAALGTALGSYVPADLEALCAALLAREPNARPSPAALRALIAGEGTPFDAPIGLRSSWPPEAPPELVGRSVELRALRDAYDHACTGCATLMFVAGDSGMGKSTLIEAFLSELREDPGTIVLAGRCYERENVPYKGFDALVDELSRCLRALPGDQVAALLPREVYALARLFPVLGRVPLVAAAERREIHDPQELQSRAFNALRELLWGLGRRGPLVLYIDDLQWLDQDTTALLAHMLGQREPMPVLALGSHRSEGAEQNPQLQAIRGLARANRTLEVRELQLGPLAHDAARTLAARCLAGHPEADALAPSLIREAQGSPFFVAELARFARRLGLRELGQISLGDALTEHVTQLPDGARALLELLALAGQPLPVALAIAAAGVADGHRALDLLRAEQLVRGSAGPDRVRRVECYHDRVREGVSRGLDEPRRRELYTALARTVERAPRGEADPELLATCYEGAGERARAAQAAEQGGDRAIAALAFERGARLFERALELGADLGRRAAEVRALRIKCAEALEWAAHSSDAAAAYRQAARDAEPGLALELKRKAAYQLMTSGLVDDGRVLLAEVLSVFDLQLASSARAGLARALLSRARLRLRGLRMQVPRTVHPVQTTRALDTLWTVVQGSAGSDPFAMVDMHARYLTLALDAGASLHAARGLGYEAYLVSFDGAGSARRASELGARALELAEADGGPEALGFVLGVRACVLVNLGRFAESRKPRTCCARAAAAWRSSSPVSISTSRAPRIIWVSCASSAAVRSSWSRTRRGAAIPGPRPSWARRGRSPRGCCATTPGKCACASSTPSAGTSRSPVTPGRTRT